LAEALLDFELRVNESANLSAGRSAPGAHDDLFVTLGVSVLEDPRRQQVGPRALFLRLAGRCGSPSVLVLDRQERDLASWHEDVIVVEPDDAWILRDGGGDRAL
jgi:hypothetical protein